MHRRFLLLSFAAVVLIGLSCWVLTKEQNSGVSVAAPLRENAAAPLAEDSKANSEIASPASPRAPEASVSEMATTAEEKARVLKGIAQCRSLLNTLETTHAETLF